MWNCTHFRHPTEQQLRISDVVRSNVYLQSVPFKYTIDPLQDPVTWYGINYAGTQITQWDFQNKGTRISPARLSFVLKVPLRHLRPSIIYSVPCYRILQRVYCVFEGDKGNELLKETLSLGFFLFEVNYVLKSLL